jgi:hypothetical protein
MSAANEADQEMPKILLETGTFKGGIPFRFMETYQELPDVFKKYYTIELGEDICRIASKRYKYFEQYNFIVPKELAHTDEEDPDFIGEQEYFDCRLKLINDDCIKALPKILAEINEPICFWLDAHSGAQKYARGQDDVPLLKELEIIKNHSVKNHIIAIDDAHLFGKLQHDKKTGEVSCDYTHVSYEVVESKIKEINSDYDVGIYAPYNMPMVLAYVKGKNGK